MSNWALRQLLKRILPRQVVYELREIKGRILTRKFPRSGEFTQSLEDSSASASVSVVVPIHDAPAVTRRCLSSLEKYAPESEVILVDDGSKSGNTLQMIKEFAIRNGWTLIRNERALGHSTACRIGARLATRDYLCLLNSDTVITPWCWRSVKEAFESDVKVGVVGPSTSYAGTPQQLTAVAELRSYFSDSQICAFARHLQDEPATIDLPWISGFAFFIRRRLWDEMGGFDEKLADYGNEVELCSRIATNGYRSVWVRSSYIHHLGQQSYWETIGEEGIVSRIQAAEAYIRQKTKSLPSHG